MPVSHLRQLLVDQVQPLAADLVKVGQVA